MEPSQHDEDLITDLLEIASIYEGQDGNNKIKNSIEEFLGEVFFQKLTSKNFEQFEKQLTKCQTRSRINETSNKVSIKGSLGAEKSFLGRGLEKPKTIASQKTLTSQDSYDEELEKLNKMFENFSLGLEDIDELKKSVVEKVLNKNTLKQDIGFKSVKFTQDIEREMKNEIEKSVINLLFEEEKERDNIDICFMIDATSSMSKYIENAYDVIERIINNIKQTYSTVKIRISIVAYRDIGDDARFQIYNFSESVLDAKNFLSSLLAEGGGDDPEDVNGGFQKALALHWKHNNRHLIHLADDPCHGLSMNGLKTGDRFPTGYYEDISWDRIFKDLKRKDINYLLLKAGSSLDFMFSKFKEIYDEVPNPSNRNLIFEAKSLTKDKEVLHKLTTTHIKSTISFHTKATRVGAYGISLYKTGAYQALQEINEEEDSDEEHKIVKHVTLNLSKVVEATAPNWYSPAFFTYKTSGTSFYNFSSGSLDDILNSTDSLRVEKVQLSIRKIPFSKGACSFAFYCRAKPELSDYHFNMVLKQSIKPIAKSTYFQTLQANTLAIFLSKEFNKACENVGLEKNLRIYFTRVLVVEIQSQYFLLEAFIPGEFEKYTNNHTYVNENVPFLTAFSHFTHHYTKGKFMVADLQGSNNLLTDPVIHSSSSSVKFTSQCDFGMKGMLAFFMHHECNEYCALLKLPQHEAQKNKSRKIVREATSFDVFSYLYKKCNYYFCNADAGSESLCDVCKRKVDMSKAW